MLERRKDSIAFEAFDIPTQIKIGRRLRERRFLFRNARRQAERLEDEVLR